MVIRQFDVLCDDDEKQRSPFVLAWPRESTETYNSGLLLRHLCPSASAPRRHVHRRHSLSGVQHPFHLLCIAYARRPGLHWELCYEWVEKYSQVATHAYTDGSIKRTRQTPFEHEPMTTADCGRICGCKISKHEGR